MSKLMGTTGRLWWGVLASSEFVAARESPSCWQRCRSVCDWKLGEF